MYILITGASRGIGLELTKRALSFDHHVLALARDPEQSPLAEIAHQFDKLKLLKLDITSGETEAKIQLALKEYPCLDIVINNAGIYLGDETISQFQESFLVNSIMPLMITKTLYPFLKKSRHPLSVQISSQMGSVEDNHSGGSLSYRASKAALNMIYKSISIDEKWLKVLLLHPGWVQTRMGGPGAMISVQESVNGLWDIVSHAEKFETGSFLNYQGEKLPW